MSQKLSICTIAIGVALIAPQTILPGIADAQTSHTRTPVLVELFTSEGCSSCPPADTFVAKLKQQQPIESADIIVLSEHVDYWDHDGWRDRFSSPDITERQRDYSTRLHVADIYTPQIVVDGTQQFVGTDIPHTLSAIQQDSQQPTIALTLTKPVIDGDRVTATISIAPDQQLKGDLYAALVDPADSTSVLKGENKGRDLHHVNVVRTLQRIGSLRELRSGPRSFTMNAPKDSNPAGMHLVVFAQHSDAGPIMGAISVPLME
jgi:hypothetical protein